MLLGYTNVSAEHMHTLLESHRNLIGMIKQKKTHDIRFVVGTYSQNLSLTTQIDPRHTYPISPLPFGNLTISCGALVDPETILVTGSTIFFVCHGSTFP